MKRSRNTMNIPSLMSVGVQLLLLLTAGLMPLAGEVKILGVEFYTALQNTDPVKRDFFLAENVNKIITGCGYVQSVENWDRYRRRYRIVINAKDIKNLNLIYYVFTDNRDYLKILKKNDLFEFRGQLVIYTPLNSRRDSYILDVILEDGAVIVE